MGGLDPYQPTVIRVLMTCILTREEEVKEGEERVVIVPNEPHMTSCAHET